MKHSFICIILLLASNYIFAQEAKPEHGFLVKLLDKNAAPNTGPAPDYSQLYYWAASPYKYSPADSTPSFLHDGQHDTSADVFFIYPTTYSTPGNEMDLTKMADNRAETIAEMRTASWNADLDDTAVNNGTDLRPILYQASVFNGSCRIFAPRYRQANLKAFLVRDAPVAQKAFDLAYADIKKAFQYYLDHDNHGRPVIIASHSQGSLHAIRLLQEFFDGKPLQRQLVCAYVIGYQIETNAFKNIPVCNSPTATGCVIGWRSFQTGELPKIVKEEDGNSICVNPLTWTTDTAWAPKELNKGSMTEFNSITAYAVSAGIEPTSKILWVTLPGNIDSRVKKMKNLHILDYNLFWMNIRDNVKQRIDAYRQNK